jgi:ABC-type xylose transport system permease subunit
MLVMNHHEPISEETLTRNWNELLQELRVTQTGVQILTAFLLTVPFTDRFSDLDELQRNAYLVIVCGSVVTTGLVVAPVAFHRVLFRQRMRRWLVEAANQCARAGLAMLALTSAGALFLVFDVVTSRGLALVALVVAVLFFTTLWAIAPVVADHTVPSGSGAPQQESS